MYQIQGQMGVCQLPWVHRCLLYQLFSALWNTKLAIFLNSINWTNMKCRCLIKIENMQYNLRSLENVNNVNEREMAFPIEHAGRQYTGENIRLCSLLVHESRHLHSYNDDTNKVYNKLILIRCHPLVVIVNTVRCLCLSNACLRISASEKISDLTGCRKN